MTKSDSWALIAFTGAGFVVGALMSWFTPILGAPLAALVIGFISGLTLSPSQSKALGAGAIVGGLVPFYIIFGPLFGVEFTLVFAVTCILFFMGMYMGGRAVRSCHRRFQR